jgi:hypothetical protein
VRLLPIPIRLNYYLYLSILTVAPIDDELYGFTFTLSLWVDALIIIFHDA